MSDEIRKFLEYEIHSSLIARHVSNVWLQNIIATYYARKVRRKYNRYKTSLREREEVISRLAKI
jgi:hypothetical protein